MLQYLVECSDGSLCVIYEKSIIFKNTSKELENGDEILFLWPEDCPDAPKYLGKIIDSDEDEAVLLDLMDSMLKKQEKKKGKAGKRKAAGSVGKSKSNSEEDIRVSSTEVDAEPSVKKRNTHHTSSDAFTECSSNSDSQSDVVWLQNAIEDLKKDITIEFAKFKGAIISSLDDFKAKWEERRNSIRSPTFCDDLRAESQVIDEILTDDDSIYNIDF